MKLEVSVDSLESALAAQVVVPIALSYVAT